MIYLSTIILSGASLLYESLIAQMMASIVGGTNIQYIMIIGVYTCFLGLGGLYYSRKKNIDIVSVELSLITVGSMFPFVLFLMEQNNINIWLVYSTGIFFAILIGFLSGLELPLLMEEYKNEHNVFSSSIYGLDFIGSFIGIISFPLILPYLNLLSIGIIIAVFNLIGLILIRGFKFRELFVLFVLILLIFGMESSFFREINPFI